MHGVSCLILFLRPPDRKKCIYDFLDARKTYFHLALAHSHFVSKNMYENKQTKQYRSFIST